ncbi:MAG: LruC domain-containing protein [Chlorobi bacterium]|nr:LruC domain-containing protein [Chlorobiota bacterium]
MKTLKYLLISLLVAGNFLFFSCKKPITTIDPPLVGLDAINVPDGFNFNTTNDVAIILKVNSDGSEKYRRVKFFIYSGDPDSTGKMIASGGVDMNGLYQTQVSLATTSDSLYISSNNTGIVLGMTAIENNMISHTFNMGSPVLRSSGSRGASNFTDIISDFENGLDGWKAYRDNSIHTSDEANTPLTTGPMGSSDKFMWGFDTRGGVRSWEAPAKFHGDLYGQYIAYHYYLGNTISARPTAPNIADVRITDGNKVLAIDLSSSFQHEVNAGWQTIYCKLDETQTDGTGWRIGSMKYWTTGNGSRTTPKKAATPAQIQQILSNVTGILLGPERQVGYYSSNGPEFIALGKVGVVSDVTSFPVIQQGEEPDDDDNDGVPNSTDDYPNDPEKAYNNYGPAEGVYGTLAYEDLWPRKGDYDFNDVVIDYNFNIITNASNEVVEMNSNFILQATGAGYLNGFAFELPVNQSTVTAVSGQNLSDGVFALNANGTEANQTNAVIVVFDDAHHIFQRSGFVNTDASLPYFDSVAINVVVSFNGSFEIAALGTAPYNPFIVANQQRGYEIHLAGKENTALADEALFGTDQDDSNAANGKYYQTSNNLPWAIHIPVSFDYPIETVSIENAHLKFVEWAESGGSTYNDWYMNKSGYRNQGYIYSH